MSDLHKIIDLSDPITQLLKAVEELKELIEVLEEVLALDSLESIKNDTKEHLIEELADVMVVTGQIPIILDIDNTEVFKVRKEKIRRTIRRLTNG